MQADHGPSTGAPHSEHRFPARKAVINQSLESGPARLDLSQFHVCNRAQELCEGRGGHPGLPVPNKPDGLCGCKAPLQQQQNVCNISPKRAGL